MVDRWVIADGRNLAFEACARELCTRTIVIPREGAVSRSFPPRLLVCGTPLDYPPMRVMTNGAGDLQNKTRKFRISQTGSRRSTDAIRPRSAGFTSGE